MRKKRQTDGDNRKGEDNGRNHFKEGRSGITYYIKGNIADDFISIQIHTYGS